MLGTSPLLIYGILSGLGLGQKLMVAAGLGIFVFYLFKSKSAAGSIVGLLGTAWFMAVSVAIALILIIVFGWADPNPSKFVSDMVDAGQMLYEAVKGPVDDFVKRQIERFI